MVTVTLKCIFFITFVRVMSTHFDIYDHGYVDFTHAIRKSDKFAVNKCWPLNFFLTSKQRFLYLSVEFIQTRKTKKSTSTPDD